MLEKLQAKIPSQTSREKFQANYCEPKLLVEIFKQKFLMKLLKQNNGNFPY